MISPTLRCSQVIAETIRSGDFCKKTNAWEQRKLGDLGTLKNGMNFSKDAMGIGFPFVNLQNIFGRNEIDANNLGKAMATPGQLKDYNLIAGDVLFVRSSVKLEGVGEAALVPESLENTTYSGFIIRFEKIDLPFPSHAEQEKISAYFKRIDTLITLHQREYDNEKRAKIFVLALIG